MEKVRAGKDASFIPYRILHHLHRTLLMFRYYAHESLNVSGIKSASVKAVALDDFPRLFDSCHIQNEDACGRPASSRILRESNYIARNVRIATWAIHAASYKCAIDEKETPFGVDLARTAHDDFR